jgi:hypothetical protein
MQTVKALLLVIVTLAFVLSPLFVTSFQGYDPSTFPVPVLRPPIQPAGWAFSIWGLIYGWLVLHSLIGLLRHPKAALWDAPRLPLILSLWLGVSWLAVANVAPIVATVQIFAMLATALWALKRSKPGADRWWRVSPVALYAGWLTAASGVSLGVVLTGYGVLSATAAALLSLLLVVLIALAVQRRAAHAPEYTAAILWALAGIVAANIAAGWLLPVVAILAMAALFTMALRART